MKTQTKIRQLLMDLADEYQELLDNAYYNSNTTGIKKYAKALDIIHEINSMLYRLPSIKGNK